jgi:hypothetical protein
MSPRTGAGVQIAVKDRRAAVKRLKLNSLLRLCRVSPNEERRDDDQLLPLLHGCNSSVTDFP